MRWTNIPENAFFNVGTIDDVIKKAEKIAVTSCQKGKTNGYKFIYLKVISANRVFFAGKCRSLIVPEIRWTEGNSCPS